MEKELTKFIRTLLILLLFSSSIFSQTIEIKALNSISYTSIPYSDTKGVLFPNFGELIAQLVFQINYIMIYNVHNTFKQETMKTFLPHSI